MHSIPAVSFSRFRIWQNGKGSHRCYSYHRSQRDILLFFLDTKSAKEHEKGGSAGEMTRVGLARVVDLFRIYAGGSITKPARHFSLPLG